VADEQPWNDSDATDEIRALAKSFDLDVFLTDHASVQMADRRLIMADVLYALKNGFVRSPSKESTQAGYFKYVMESTTPNSSSRTVGVVLVPNRPECQIKIITVMWIDEMATRAGTIIGEDV